MCAKCCAGVADLRPILHPPIEKRRPQSCCTCIQTDPSVRFFVMVTADHSTPVSFGDHSHEPVPLAVAAVSRVVAALGCDAVKSVHMGPLPSVTQHSLVDVGQLREQADGMRREREALAGKEALESGAEGDFAPALRFDEITASRGALGRFPSSELMPWVRALLQGNAGRGS